jgi:hypothetical protein
MLDAEATEVAQYWRAVSGLPAVALGEAVAGAVSWVTAELIGQINRLYADFHHDDKTPITPRGLTPVVDQLCGRPA